MRTSLNQNPWLKRRTTAKLTILFLQQKLFMMCPCFDFKTCNENWHRYLTMCRRPSNDSAKYFKLIWSWQGNRFNKSGLDRSHCCLVHEFYFIEPWLLRFAKLLDISNKSNFHVDKFPPSPTKNSCKESYFFALSDPCNA